MDPTLFAFVLGMGSAITLAGANTFVKAAKDILGARAVMALSSAVLVLPAAFFVPLPGQQTWMILALSLPAHWLYQTALVRALSRGDLSLVFPVMRGSAPLLTALAAAIVLGEQLSPLAMTGLIVASLATVIFALPERNFGGSRKVRNSARHRRGRLLAHVFLDGALRLFHRARRLHVRHARDCSCLRRYHGMVVPA